MNIKESINVYYDERAEEYDEIYTGKGPASINDTNAYKADVQRVMEVIEGNKPEGILIDIPCGTAFWMPSYFRKTNRIYLIDQSRNMLIKAKERSENLFCNEKCKFIQADILKMESIDCSADFIVVGFFLSHLLDVEVTKFMAFLKKQMKNRSKILVIDSVWSEERSLNRKKEGTQSRRLNDGTEFEIYKKYFNNNEIYDIGKRNDLKTEIVYFGKTMFIASFQ